MTLLLLHVLVVVVALLHILLRRHRQPESRAAWMLMVLALPYVGALAYLLVGQTSVGRARIERMREAQQSLPSLDAASGWEAVRASGAVLGDRERLFRVGASISNYAAVSGNRAQLMADSDAAIEAMVAAIDAAKQHVHLMFYIWLDDHNGRRMAQALIRAAGRGVACRAMIDDLGSRDFQKTATWRALKKAGVLTRRALPVGIPLLRMLRGRIDLRDHRKILVIDNRVTFCGSQNCADPAFLPKARFAPWVDVVMRVEGPVVRQNQHLFACDWMGNGGDDIAALLGEPLEEPGPGFVAQVIGTGPTYRDSAMPELFQTLIYAARRELLITTPYYVPVPGVQAALCAAANRGVKVGIIFPARNDDFAVGAASRSYYEELLQAGVSIHEFQPGLLHAKTLTLDGEICLIGSANMDRRSFDLNYENNILLRDVETTAALHARQLEFLAQSRAVTLEDVRGWSALRRIWNNTLAILGPVL